MAKAPAKKKDSTDAELLRGLASDSYTVYSAAESELQGWFAAHPDAAVARATKLCEAALGSEHAAARDKVGYVALPVVAHALAKGQVLPQKWDPLISVYGDPVEIRAMVLPMPAARREAIFAREVATGDSNRIWRLVDLFLDLAPGCTRPILDYFASRNELRQRLSWIQLTKWKTNVPEVAAILKEYEARAKKLPKLVPPPRPAGSFTFTDPVVIGPRDYAKLDALGKAQYRAAAEAYLGGKVKDAAHFVKRLEADDMNEGDAEMRRWKISKAGQHLYDLWVVWVDNGTFFHAGKSTRAPAYLVQDSYLPIGKSAAAKALADDLGNSAPQDLWSIGKVAKKKSPKKKTAKAARPRAK